jgi:two-component system chemotaxis response regulator CheB
MASKIRVMLVDDSAVVRGLFDRALKADPAIEVVASASNGQMAISMLRQHPVDVIVLDVEMPVMDGITALPQLLAIAPNTRVVMASTLTKRNAEISLKALELGATDYIPKPSSKEPGEVNEFYASLIMKIKALAPRGTTSAASAGASEKLGLSASPSKLFEPISAPNHPVKQITRAERAEALAIASSTGGPQALLAIFREFKGRKLRVPVFITQHMPPNFTTILADHLTKASGLDCREAVHDEVVVPGRVYVAPGDFHMTVSGSHHNVRILLNQDDQENFCRPSADPMLRGLSKAYNDRLLLAVLTGLGSDGARGALEVVNHGGTVVSQDEATCVVYGMPKAVADARLTSAVLPLPSIASFLLPAVT